MNSRNVALIVGILTIALGSLGLLDPEVVMKHILGVTVDPSHSVNAVKGEIRATYGGLFVVMGVYTLLAAMNPAAHRARLLFVGLLWLGACAGRLVGVSVDGSPGLPGWIAVASELLLGGALVAAALIKPPTGALAAAPVQPTLSQP